jgi:multidrug resistance protein, MATE family
VGGLAIVLGLGFMSGAALIFFLLGRPIASAFSADPEVVAVGGLLFVVAAAFQLFDGLQAVATGVLRGLGDTRTPMVTNLLGHWALGLPLGFLLCFGLGHGIVGLWIGLSTGLMAVGLVLLATWRYRAARLAPSS